MVAAVDRTAPTPVADVVPSVTYDLTTDDAMAPTDLAGSRSAADRRWLGRAMMFAGSTAATAACLAGADALNVRTAATSAVLTAVFVAAYTGFLWPDPAKGARRAVAAQLAANRRRTVAVEPDGIRSTHGFGETFTRWPGVARAAVTDRHLLLFARSGTTVVVPRRAFASAGEFDAFAAAVLARVEPDVDRRPTGGFPVLPPPAAR